MDEPTRDPALAAALRELDGPPAAEPEWDALRARVTASAALPLARRRRALGLRRGLRAIVPLAAAAGIAALALGGLTDHNEPRLSQEERAVVEEILTLSTPDQVELLMTGQATEQALLDAVEAGPSQ
jgi:hypothetical protein